MGDILFDPFNPAHFADPYPHMSLARQLYPVVVCAPDTVFIARDVEVRVVLEHPTEYLYESHKTWEVYNERDGFTPPVDPPQHDSRHQILKEALSPRYLRSRLPAICDAADSLARQLAEREQADLMDELARPLSLASLAHLIDIPEEEQVEFYTYIMEITANVPILRRQESWHSFTAYICHLIARHSSLAHPPDDLLTRLMFAEVDGIRLSDDEVCVTIYHLLLWGKEPTAYFIGNLLYELLHVPQRWQSLRVSPGLIEATIEEALRYSSPLNWVRRTCGREIMLHDVALKEGTRMLVGLSSANRDEARWLSSDKFLPDRPHVHTHLTFGHGPHACPVPHLARLEARIALEALLTHCPNLRLAPAFQYEPVGGAMLRGPKRLDVWLHDKGE